MVKRKSLIIHFRSPRVVKEIEKKVNMIYYHKKRRYCVCYVNESDAEKIVKELRAMKLVKRVEESMFDTDEYQLEFDVK